MVLTIISIPPVAPGDIREGEVRAAASASGVPDVSVVNYRDQLSTARTHASRSQASSSCGGFAQTSS